MHTISIKQTGISLGLFWALCMLLISLFAMQGIGKPMADMMMSVYPGYTLTGGGILMGIIFGFIDGLIGGALFAWIYNSVGKKMK